MSSGFQLARAQAESYELFTRVFMDGSAQLLAAAGSVRPGDTVLDLACGTGLVARHVVPLVAPNGRVVGADVNAAMLEVARNSVDGSVEWVEASCDALPFDDGTFTRVLCQQGFQFFPDLSAAMSETGRVLRVGGLLLATVWAIPGQNPYIENQLDLLGALDSSLAASMQRATPPDADQILRAAATSAGFDEVDVTLLEHYVTIDEFQAWFLSQTAATPWGAALAVLGDAGRQDLAAAMAKRVEQFETPEGSHRLPFRSHLLQARWPG